MGHPRTPMIISFFQILELWIIIESTYRIPLKLFMIITKKTPKIPEDIPRRRILGTMWSRDPYHPIYTDLGTPITQSMWSRDSYHQIYTDKVEQKNQDFESMNNIT